MAMKLQHRTSPFDHRNPAVVIHQQGVGNGGGAEPLADLAELMNDWFFGTGNRPRDMSGVKKAEDAADDGMKKMSASRQTQQWLEEAKRVIASSPARTSSPSKFPGSPRFAAGHGRETAGLERRDPLSRSARRQRGRESFSGEILTRHHRNASDAFPSDDHHDHFLLTASATTEDDAPPSFLPLRPSSVGPRRKSRFQDEPPPPAIPPRRAFRDAPSAASAEPDSRRNLLLSPPRNLVETANRRSISSSTCSIEKISGQGLVDPGGRRRSVSARSESAGWHLDQEVLQINAFLRRQRTMMERISTGRVTAKAKIVLSDSSATSTTSSMVAAICYAWLLENREKRVGGDGVVVPVMNMKRARMHRNWQAAWLFHYFSIDGSSLLFSDEVDLDGLIMARQLSVIVTGQDVLNTNNEVGSPCTILTDNYCEDAYDLLQTPNLKKLLLAGILLDTHNLDKSAKFHSHRDVEAIQLLLVGSTSSLRQELFEYLMQDHKDKLFLEALRRNYGNPPDNDENGSRALIKKSTSSSLQEDTEIQPKVLTAVPSPSPAPSAAQTPERATRGKSKFYFAKWFGFISR